MKSLLSVLLFVLSLSPAANAGDDLESLDIQCWTEATEPFSVNLSILNDGSGHVTLMSKEGKTTVPFVAKKKGSVSEGTIRYDAPGFKLLVDTRAQIPNGIPHAEKVALEFWSWIEATVPKARAIEIPREIFKSLKCSYPI
jgi:hypothetical protein